MLSLGALRCRYPELSVEQMKMNVLKKQDGMNGEVIVVELFG